MSHMQQGKKHTSTKRDACMFQKDDGICEEQDRRCRNRMKFFDVKTKKEEMD